MGRAYSQDLRDRILACYQRGMMTREIAQVFAVSPAWARRVRQRQRDQGERSPRPMGGLRVMKVDMEQLRQWVSQKPDATTRELHQRLVNECGIACSESAVGMALVRLGLSFKKRRCMLPSRIAPMSLPNAMTGKQPSLSVSHDV
jgi:transposase